jgi:hypothetical protein
VENVKLIFRFIMRKIIMIIMIKDECPCYRNKQDIENIYKGIVFVATCLISRESHCWVRTNTNTNHNLITYAGSIA